MLAIDVFIPVYNDLRFLPRAVSSVLKQEGVDLRVVISDNDSTDGTYEWAMEAASRNPSVIVHRNSANIGMIGNLNRFRDLVAAPYFMLLCSDDILTDPGALAKAQAIMEANPAAVSVHCDMVYIDGRDRTLATRRFRRSGEFSGEQALRQSVVGCRNLFGIPLLHRAGPLKALSYPEGLTYTADICLSAEAAKLGTLYHIPELFIGNRYTGKNLTSSVIAASRIQFAALEDRFRLKLAPGERFQQRINYLRTLGAKRLFLSWAAFRSREAINS